MKKKIVSLFTIFLSVFLLRLITAEAFTNALTVFVNGKRLCADSQISNDRTMVPMRAIFEALGYGVEYDKDTHTAIAGEKPAVLQPKREDGVIRISVNGAYVDMDTDPYVDNGTTYVPARFIADSAGEAVEWDAAANAVYIGKVAHDTYKAFKVDANYGYGSSLHSLDNSNLLFIKGRNDILYCTTQDNSTAVIYKSYTEKFKENTFADMKITTVGGEVYYGFEVWYSFYDHNMGSIALFGATYYNNGNSYTEILYTGGKFYTYDDLGFPDGHSKYSIFMTLSDGAYMLVERWDYTYFLSLYPDVVYKDTPEHFHDVWYYEKADLMQNKLYEYDGYLYYLISDTTLNNVDKTAYTLYRYDIYEGIEEQVMKFEPIKHRPMFANGQIFEETSTGFNVYSLTGHFLRTITIENREEIHPISWDGSGFDIDNTKGIQECPNGKIYFFDGNQLIMGIRKSDNPPTYTDNPNTGDILHITLD